MTAAGPSFELPQEVVAATLQPRALQYLTRGLTSNIYTFDLTTLLSTPQLEARPHLSSLKAHPTKLAVKCVDIEDQVRPHDVAKEIRILQIASQSDDSRARSIVSLLGTSLEEPDDFTCIQRLYMPFYPYTLTEWLQEDANRQGRRDSQQQGQTHSNSRCQFAVSLANQLFSTLTFLHERGLAHRDLKPSNILLTSLEDDAEIRLCDFGTAHQCSTSKPRPTTCSTSTHPYTPPELLFSPDGGYDGSKVDVWEAACIVAETFGQIDEVEGGTTGGSKRPASLMMEDEEDDQDELRASAPGEKRQGKMLYPNTSSDSSDPFGSDDEADEEEEWKQLQQDLWNGQPPPSSSGLGQSPFPSLAPSKQQQQRNYHHRSLFKPDVGDLGLAGDIFEFLGLPEAHQSDLWPEARSFHPPLDRMPFARREAPQQPEALLNRLPLLALERETRKGEALIEVLVACLRLSAAERWTPDQVVKRLKESM